MTHLKAMGNKFIGLGEDAGGGGGSVPKSVSGLFSLVTVVTD